MLTLFCVVFGLKYFEEGIASVFHPEDGGMYFFQTLVLICHTI
jgi:hypothetical protein